MSPVVVRWLPTSIVALSSVLLITQVLHAQQVPDQDDLQRYFESSAWVVGNWVLYKDIFSEYPLFANLLFAAVRWLNVFFGNGFLGFSIIWITLAALCTSVTCSIALRFVAQNAPNNDLWILALSWLAPGILHFALLRFDIYPALATLGMMICLYRKRYRMAGLWIGLGIALKGYPIFLLPVILIYTQRQAGGRALVHFLLPALAIPSLSLLAILAFAGFEGLLSPFQFHGHRDFNPDSTYTLLRHLLDAPLHASDMSPLPLVLQALCVVLPLFFRQEDFDELVSALTFTLVSIINFSVFYSPQFAIWLLPIAGLSRDRAMQYLLLAYALWTAGYFAVEALQNTSSLLVLITGLVTLRLALMFRSFQSLCASKEGLFNR